MVRSLTGSKRDLCSLSCLLQGCAAAAVFRLHWITHRGPGGTADVSRGAVRLHLTERVRSLVISGFYSAWQPFTHEYALEGGGRRGRNDASQQFDRIVLPDESKTLFVCEANIIGACQDRV